MTNTPHDITIGLTGLDWEPSDATRYFAQEQRTDNYSRFAFGPTPEAALAALAVYQETRVLYWVMYSENVAMQDGTVKTRTTQHYGTESLETAKKSVLEFRDYASRGKHFLRTHNPNNCINSAWVEIETRTRVDF